MDVAVLRVTLTPFMLIKLRGSLVMTLSKREILIAVDRARSMHKLLFCTPDQTYWALLETKEFMERVRSIIKFGQSERMPTVAQLITHLNSSTFGSALEFHATTTKPELPLGRACEWTIPHPYNLDVNLFWPSECAELIKRSFDLDAIGLSDAPQDPFSLSNTVKIFLAESPFVLLFMAALSCATVRTKWIESRMNVMQQSVWSYLLHVFLLRAIDMYWKTDAAAAIGISGMPGVCCILLPEPRLVCLANRQEDPPLTSTIVRYESTLDGFSSTGVSSSITSELSDMLWIDRSFPLVVRIDQHTPWREFPTVDSLSAANRNYTGLISLMAVDSTKKRWFLVAECALDLFISMHPPCFMPIEKTRVCRQLAFYREDETPPVGATILSTHERISMLGDLFVSGTKYALVDLAPGQFVDSHTRLPKERIPASWWPLTSVSELLHPLRTSPQSHEIYANDRWWKCNGRGPSVCLTPDPQIESVRSVLAFQLSHSTPSTPAPTSLFICTPPSMAAFPHPAPKWPTCRLGCAKCHTTSSIARCGDGALLCRQELACVLWWHWHQFAERLLCWSSRADELGERWFRHECWRLTDRQPRPAASAKIKAPTPVSLDSMVIDSTSPQQNKVNSALKYSNGSSTTITFRDNSTWEIPKSIATANDQQRISPLGAHVVYLLYHISDTTAQDYNQWVRVGRMLRTIDVASTELRFAWRWWSRRYGGSTYKDSDFDPSSAKWEVLGTNGDTQQIAKSMLALVGMAKKVQGSLTYADSTVQRVFAEFWQDGTTWWGMKNH